MVASSGNESLAQAEKGIYHARKAVLLGCVAVGAVFSGDQGSAGAYMQRAQMHLKDCFDSLLPEVGRGAVVALPLCCFFFFSLVLFARASVPHETEAPPSLGVSCVSAETPHAAPTPCFFSFF